MIAEKLARFSLWSIRKIGVRTLVSVILLMVILGSVSSGLNRIVRDPEPTTLTINPLVALLFGWALARTRLPGWQAGLWVVGLGLATNLVLVGRLGGKLLSLLQALAGLVSEALRWRLHDPPPDASLVSLALQDLGRNLAALLSQALAWIAALLGGRPAYDPLAAALAWGLALWGAAAWAAWAVRRRGQPLAGVLPAAALLAVSLAYSRAPAAYLLPVLASAFLLMAWMDFNAR